MKSSLEDSCKFSVGKPYNDKRWTVVLDEPTDEDITTILEILKLDGALLDFYKYREKIWGLSDHTISEFGVGFDMKEIVKKLYYNIDGYIYGMGTKRGKTGFRHYRCLENYPKPQITKLIGEKDTIFEIISDYKPEYKDFFHSEMWKSWEERGSNNIETILQAEPNSYHVAMRKLNFEVEKNHKLIKKLLKSHGCNIENIDNWIYKNNRCIINLIGLSKNDITFYYNRINKE
jgi:hypothetical protein